VHDVFEPKPKHVPLPYILLCPSITPIEENNPAFRLFSLNKLNLNLHDYSQYYMDLTLSNGKLLYAILSYKFENRIQLFFLVFSLQSFYLEARVYVFKTVFQ